MASSSPKAYGNVACLFENQPGLWFGGNIPKTSEHPQKLLSLSSKRIEMRAKSKEGNSEKEWQLLSSALFNHPSYSNGTKRFMTLWTKKTPTDWSLYLEVDKDFLKNLEELYPTFHVEGEVRGVRDSGPLYPDEQGELHTYGSSVIIAQDFNCVELLRDALGFGTIPLLEETMMIQGDAWYFYLSSWNFFISWKTKTRNLRQGLGSNNSILAKMYSCEQTKDLTIVVGNGAEVKCHKAVFAAQSSVLAAMIAPESGMQEAKTARVELKELSKEGIGFLLPYFYEMKTPISELNCDVAAELIQAAHKYNLPELETGLEKALLKKGADWFTADALLELYYFSKNVEEMKNLEKHALKLMTRMPENVKECQRYKELEQAEQCALAWVLVSHLTSSPSVL